MIESDFRKTRITILLVTATLIAVGIIMIYSSSAVYAYEHYGDNLFFLKRYLASFIIGCFLAMLFMAIDLEVLRRHSRKLLLGSTVLLVLVLIPEIGYAIGGARRWFRLGVISLQPVEFVKPFLLLYIADFLDRKSLKGTTFSRVYLPVLLVICLICALVLMQPDLGTSVELALIGFVMLFAYGAELKHLALTFTASLPFLAFIVMKSPYRLARIVAFIDPWKDPKGTGFQMIQSLIALGSGGLLGVGLGGSKQKLFYLPESHTDFIFAIMGEELGFLGAAAIVILFFIIVWKGISIALRKESEFSRLLALGIASMIGVEAFINIGVSAGILPTKGLPLPFVSYGGSSLVAHMILIAILLNLSRYKVR